jgi:hypothetical protein
MPPSPLRWPTYCPIDVAFDARLLEHELMALSPQFRFMPANEAFVENRRRWFEEGNDYVHDNVTRAVRSADGRDTVIHGRVPSWSGLSLTHVPGAVGTGSSYFRRVFRDRAWAWIPGLAGAYTRELVESLPFKEMRAVRIMSMPAGAFGPVHVDYPDDTLWEKDGVISITFLLKDGGVPLRFLAADGRVHEARDPVSFFKDCAPHAVPLTESSRLLLRVNGTGEPEAFQAILQRDRAVW